MIDKDFRRIEEIIREGKLPLTGLIIIRNTDEKKFLVLAKKIFQKLEKREDNGNVSIFDYWIDPYLMPFFLREVRPFMDADFNLEVFQYKYFRTRKDWVMTIEGQAVEEPEETDLFMLHILDFMKKNH